MGYVDHATVSIINTAFDKLDVDGTQMLNMTDVLAAHEGNSLSLVDELRREYGISETDEEAAPVGFLGIRTHWGQRTPPKESTST